MRICYETAPSGGHSWQLAESRPMHKHGIITNIHNTLHVRFLCIISSVCVLMSCEDSHVWTLHQFPARTPCTLLPDRSRNETQIVPSPDLLEIPDSIPQTAASHGECKLMQMHLTRLANITLGPHSAGAADRVGGGAWTRSPGLSSPRACSRLRSAPSILIVRLFAG